MRCMYTSKFHLVLVSCAQQQDKDCQLTFLSFKPKHLDFIDSCRFFRSALSLPSSLSTFIYLAISVFCLYLSLCVCSFLSRVLSPSYLGYIVCLSFLFSVFFLISYQLSRPPLLQCMYSFFQLIRLRGVRLTLSVSLSSPAILHFQVRKRQRRLSRQMLSPYMKPDLYIESRDGEAIDFTGQSFYQRNLCSSLQNTTTESPCELKSLSLYLYLFSELPVCIRHVHLSISLLLSLYFHIGVLPLYLWIQLASQVAPIPSGLLVKPCLSLLTLTLSIYLCIQIRVCPSAGIYIYVYLFVCIDTGIRCLGYTQIQADSIHTWLLAE